MRKTLIALAVLAAVVTTPAHAGRKDGGIWGFIATMLSVGR